MISAPVVQVQCDHGRGEDLCRRAQVFTLPSFSVDRASIAALFRMLYPDWAVGAERILCPQCRRIAELAALEKKGALA